MKYRTARPQPTFGFVLRDGVPAISGKRGKAPSLPASFFYLLIFTTLVGACHHAVPKQPPPQVAIEPLSFQISSGEDRYQIEGYFAHSAEPGRMPALLVLNGDGGDARQCI